MRNSIRRPTPPNLMQLANTQPMPSTNMGFHDLDEVAELALTIGQVEHRRRPPPGLILTELIPYRERSENQRALLREHVAHVVQSLILLGWLNSTSD